MMVEILDPQPGEKIIDPACGSGGFLLPPWNMFGVMFGQRQNEKLGQKNYVGGEK